MTLFDMCYDHLTSGKCSKMPLNLEGHGRSCFLRHHMNDSLQVMNETIRKEVRIEDSDVARSSLCNFNITLSEIEND